MLVNRTYLTHVSKTAASAADRNYLLECLQTANWLVKSLDQRARTILRVAEEIVRQQDGFFTHGVQYLRPLNLKTVADAISMHESTVSRVTSNKYVATPRGIFELKYFFTSAIASAEEGESHSSEAVRHRIKQMIDGETPATVLSDDKIVEKLKNDGIEIARRTVAKYREAMRIPSSVQRRRDKRLSERVERAPQMNSGLRARRGLYAPPALQYRLALWNRGPEPRRARARGRPCRRAPRIERLGSITSCVGLLRGGPWPRSCSAIEAGGEGGTAVARLR